MSTLSALVLAGGYSRRMGIDKALLPMPHRQPLLLNTVQIAQQVATEVAVVTPWPSRYRTLLAPTNALLIQEPSLPHPPNNVLDTAYSDTAHRDKPSAGPLSGFAYGWQHVSTEWCLLLACDLPYLDADALAQWWNWIELLPELDSPMASLVARRRGWQPLCGFYHRRCLPSLNRYLATAQRGFQPWLQQVSVARYDNISTQMFFNCNTPVEWSAVIGE